MGSKMMEMMSRHVAENDKDLERLMRGLVTIQVLIAQQPASEEAERFAKELFSIVANEKYALVMSVNKEGR